MTRAYIAKDKKGRWYLVVQEGAGSAHYGILNGIPIAPPANPDEIKAISEEFDIK